MLPIAARAERPQDEATGLLVRGRGYGGVEPGDGADADAGEPHACWGECAAQVGLPGLRVCAPKSATRRHPRPRGAPRRVPSDQSLASLDTRATHGSAATHGSSLEPDEPLGELELSVVCARGLPPIA